MHIHDNDGDPLIILMCYFCPLYHSDVEDATLHLYTDAQQVSQFSQTKLLFSPFNLLLPRVLISIKVTTIHLITQDLNEGVIYILLFTHYIKFLLDLRSILNPATPHGSVTSTQSKPASSLAWTTAKTLERAQFSLLSPPEYIVHSGDRMSL